MTDPRHREVVHETTVHAPADAVYRLIADVLNWPRLFPPTVYVDQVETCGRQERIRIWAMANGRPKSWTSRRTLLPEQRRIEFRQEVSAHPVATMGGAWQVDPLPSGAKVLLWHDYRAATDDPADLAWIDEAVDRNSRSELAALKSTVEQIAGGADELTFSFEDSVRIDGAAEDVYDFLNEAQHWPRRLPHVVRASLSEETPGLQVLGMDTRTANGAVHATESVRVCFPHHRIAYKQIALPALMTLHTGCWRIEERGEQVVASSQHTVTINSERITEVLGDGAGVPQAREFVRNALGANSMATLGHAKAHAERQ
ncbi:aromatase/cyclase [Amycolatopsis nigrescens]|uniref:aromatase/cyclase n=1 Tax=Amycolatopsis nigrescens TaxID=381445 RepID=UPI00036DBFF0|nr:aromatase/cyclase [Amycolatopsis nigrescens]